MEKRKYLRINLENLSVDVSDGMGVFPGKISDISRFGVCITDLPRRLNGDVDKMTIVVSRKDQHFRMNVRPRWYTDGGATKSVGSEITDAPSGWTEFVRGFEPALPKGVWGGIRL